MMKWDELGSPLRFGGTQIDITNYKQVEQQLRHATSLSSGELLDQG